MGGTFANICSKAAVALCFFFNIIYCFKKTSLAATTSKKHQAAKAAGAA